MFFFAFFVFFRGEFSFQYEWTRRWIMKGEQYTFGVVMNEENARNKGEANEH